MKRNVQKYTVLPFALIVLLSLFTLPHQASASVMFSLREHQSSGSGNPAFLFGNSSGTLTMNTTTTSLGTGYIFIVVPRMYLNDKYIYFNWTGYWSTADAFAYVRIYDGDYFRASLSDFPVGSALDTKGKGLLQSIVTKSGTFSYENVDVMIDVEDGTRGYCTVFFYIYDAYTARYGNLSIDYFAICNASGNTDIEYNETFTSSPTMEVTGTYNDYGYVSSGSIDETTFYVSEWVTDTFAYFSNNTITNIAGDVYATISTLVLDWTNALSYGVDTITTTFDFIAGTATFVIDQFTSIVDMFLQLATIVSRILDGTQTGIGTLIDIWTYIGYSSWSQVVPLFMLIAWWNSLDNRARKTGLGWISVFWGDLNIILGVVSFIFDWSFRILSWVIDWIFRFIDVIA